MDLEYANETGRPSSPVVTALGRVIPGIAAVQAQHQPYAQAWHEANLAALSRPGPRWIVLGDSMSQGVGAHAFNAGWVNRVHERLHENGLDYELINLSANGARASDVLNQQIPAWRASAAGTWAGAPRSGHLADRVERSAEPLLPRPAAGHLRQGCWPNCPASRWSR